MPRARHTVFPIASAVNAPAASGAIADWWASRGISSDNLSQLRLVGESRCQQT